MVNRRGAKGKENVQTVEEALVLSNPHDPCNSSGIVQSAIGNKSVEVPVTGSGGVLGSMTKDTSKTTQQQQKEVVVVRKG